jgi:hypothetical protein
MPEEVADLLVRRLACQLTDLVALVDQPPLFAEDMADPGGSRHHAL